MNTKLARLVLDCYNNGVDTGFFVNEKYYCLRHESDWVLKIGDFENNNLLMYDIAFVNIEPSDIDPDLKYLIFDTGGDVLIKVLLEGEE